MIASALVREDAPTYGQKRCPDCARLLPLDSFPRNRSTVSGLATYCRTCHNARTRASVTRNGGARRYHFRRRYGIEPAEFDRLLRLQSGCCAVCNDSQPTQVDHDHTTARVRGILCLNCNAALGAFGDDPAIIRRAIVYLERDRP